MSCKGIFGLTKISLGCSDVPIGGVKKVYAIKKSDLPDTNTILYGKYVPMAHATQLPVNLEFDRNDKKTNYSFESVRGGKGLNPRITTQKLELVVNNLSIPHFNSVDKLIKNKDELVLFIKTNSDTDLWWIIGINRSLPAGFPAVNDKRIFDGIDKITVNSIISNSGSNENNYLLTFENETLIGEAYILDDDFENLILTL